MGILCAGEDGVLSMSSKGADMWMWRKALRFSALRLEAYFLVRLETACFFVPTCVFAADGREHGGRTGV